MTDTITVPTYPAGSHHFLKRFLPNLTAPINSANEEIHNTRALDIVIIGAGVGGLATAVALKTAGFHVTVYESSPVLSEIGAGIQVPPNSSRILHSWKLEAELKQKSVRPRGIIWRRWEDGNAIGHTRFIPQFEKWFGAPYYVIHRAHLHEVLHKRAEQLGVVTRLDTKVVKYNIDEPSFELQDGSIVRADLIVAADGIRSTARRALLGNDYTSPINSGLAAYRAAVAVEDIKSNPKTAWIADSGSLNFWVGNQSHVMSYMIAGGRLYNLVLTHPESLEPSDWDQSKSLADMRSFYAAWDPSLVELLKMVSSAQKWPIQSVQIPNTWSSPSGNLVLIGDAAHAMLPNMSQGAAMAVEDAAALAECLKAYPSKEKLRSAIDVYERLRIPRTRNVHEASVLHGYTFHYPDGPLQQARDAAMRPEVDGEHFIDSPNQFSDPTTQLYCYMYDVVAETQKELSRERESTSTS